jgi:hypothetical protein
MQFYKFFKAKFDYDDYLEVLAKKDYMRWDIE